MTTPSILIRADASRAIGTGHVRRCIALADALRDAGAECAFSTRLIDFDTAAMIERAGYRTHILETGRIHTNLTTDNRTGYQCWSPVSELVDAQQVSLTAQHYQAVIVDHYSFAAPWHDYVRQMTGCRIIALDDLGERGMSADIIVDHNLSPDARAKHAASCANGAILFTGPRYAMIDAVYATAPRYAFCPVVRSIGIFMGGVDAAGLSLPIARALREQGFAGSIGVATTSANPQLRQIADAQDLLGAVPLIDADNLAGFFANHDLQIGAAGGATWERCAIGAPSLLVQVAENQRHTLGPMDRARAAVVIEDSYDVDGIAGAALTLADDEWTRRSLAEKSRALVDGRGVTRVGEAVLALFERRR